MRNLHRRVRLAAGWLGALALPLLTTPALAADAAEKPVSWYDRIVVKGFLQLDATFPEGKSAVGGYSNLRLRRARPTIIGTIDPLTKLQLQIEAGSGKAGSGASNVILMDTYAERLVPGLGVVRFGQFALPFGIETAEDTAARRSPLELSFAMDRVAINERDIGVSVQSSANAAADTHWAVALFNGQGVRTADANANKTLAGRIAQSIGPSVRVGVSGLLGTYVATDKNEYDRHVLGFEVQVRSRALGRFSGEFCTAKFIDSLTAAKPAKVDYHGGYLMYEARIADPKSTPFIRYQRTYGDLDYRSVDLGFRYDYAPNQRLTAEYDIVRGADQNAFGLRWQLGF